MIFVEEIIAAALLFGWVIFVATIFTKWLYRWMIKRNSEPTIALYYNRKIIHILTGGFCAVLVPFVFRTAIVPLVMAILLAVLIYAPHRTENVMFWFQTKENIYEVSFCIMWGTIITLGWWMSGGNFWLGVIPVLFMSVGDAVTGIVRNYIYKKRTKSWWGNLTMAVVSMSLGAVLGAAGIVAGVVASIAEHFEYYPIDDNVTVPLVSFLILIISRTYAPWLLGF